MLQTRVAVMAIIVEEPDAVSKLNEQLHEFSEYIVGRMGIPYKTHGISIISVALAEPPATKATLAGRQSDVKGQSVKHADSNVVNDAETDR